MPWDFEDRHTHQSKGAYERRDTSWVTPKKLAIRSNGTTSSYICLEKGYDATKPWIMKMRADGDIALEVVQYVDDMRIIAATRELVWLCSSKMAKGLCFLGLQDVTRKRREPIRHTGAWAGATVMTDGKVVCKGVIKERWTKLQAKIRWIGKQLDLSNTFSRESDQEVGENTIASGGSGLHFKSLECNVGFIVYVAMTYMSMIPYLKDILDLEFLEGKSKQGWVERIQ
jgi:hypothetical protein